MDRIANKVAADKSDRPPAAHIPVIGITCLCIAGATVLVSWILSVTTHQFSMHRGDWFWVWICTWVAAWGAAGICFLQPRRRRIGIGVAAACACNIPLMALAVFGAMAELAGN